MVDVNRREFFAVSGAAVLLGAFGKEASGGLDEVDKKIYCALEDTYEDVYDERVKLEPGMRIFRDLHADDPDKVYALTWIDSTAKRLGKDTRFLQKADKTRDYSVRELVALLRKA